MLSKKISVSVLVVVVLLLSAGYVYYSSLTGQVVAPTGDAPETEWEHTYSTYGSGMGVEEISDGYAIITLSGYFLKIDKNGNIRPGAKTIGISQAWSMQKTRDEGYIVTGPDPGCLIKLKKDGTPDWGPKYFSASGYTNSLILSAQETNDGGYIAAGEVYKPTTGSQFYPPYVIGYGSVILIKTDSNGNEKWRKLFDEKRFDGALSVQQTDDDDDGIKNDGYIIAGWASDSTSFNPFVSTPRSILLIKTDSKGVEERRNTFNAPRGVANSFSVQQTTDGGYIIAGFDGSGYLWLIKTKPNLEIEWNELFAGYMLGWKVQQTSDGGYIVAGGNEISGSRSGWLLKTDSDGKKEWSKSICTECFGLAVQETNDSGFIVVGGDLFSSTQTKLFITKLKPTDKNPPTVSVSGASVSWKNTDLTASVSCTDDKTGCDSSTYKLKKYSTPVSFCSTNYEDYDQIGPLTVSSRSWVCAAAKDNAGNLGVSDPTEFKIDKEEPSSTVKCNGETCKTTAYDNTVSVTLSCTDTGGAGCKNIYYCKTAGTQCTPSDIYTTSISASSGGTNTVKYYAEDNAGNKETTKTQTITIQTNKPTTTISEVPSAWTNEDIIFTLTCSDPNNDCKTTEYKIIASTGTCDTSGLSTYSDTVSVTCDADSSSQKKVCYRSTDDWGNTEDIKTSGTFKIDKIKPITTITPDGIDWTKNNTAFTLKCSDLDSSCERTEFKVINKDESCGAANLMEEGESGLVSCPTNQECEKKVCYMSTDKAGNLEDTKESGIFKINQTAAPTDSTAPEITDVSVSDKTPSSAKITVTINEPGLCKYSLTDTEYNSMIGTLLADETTHTAELTNLESNKNYTYYIRCTDVFGNDMQASESTTFKTSGIQVLGYCGDGNCTGTENQDNCCKDCGCPSGFECTASGCKKKTICGDGKCDADLGETQSSCCYDCGCPIGFECVNNECREKSEPKPVCGDGKCESELGENYENCCTDCKCPEDYECKCPEEKPECNKEEMKCTEKPKMGMQLPSILLIITIIAIAAIMGVLIFGFTRGWLSKRKK